MLSHRYETHQKRKRIEVGIIPRAIVGAALIYGVALMTVYDSISLFKKRYKCKK